MKARHSPYPRPFVPTPSSPSEGEFDGMRDCDPYSVEEKLIQCANPMDLTRRPTPEMPLKADVMVQEHRTITEEKLKGSERQHEVEALEGNTNAENETTRIDNQHSLEPDDDGLSLQEMPMDHEEVNTGNEFIHNEPHPQATVQPRLKLTFAQLNLRSESPIVEPLKYGDLVVVDYAEKRKVHKWPAIVILSLTYLI
jgi:hypothetical protein